MHIVSDLSHLAGATYEMSLCSIGIMGTPYTRNEPLTTFVELYQGESLRLTIPHIFYEYSPIRKNAIYLRQSSSSELSFVTISVETKLSQVHIDTKGIPAGDYELRLESYDFFSNLRPTLKTDIIQISIKSTDTTLSQYISAVEPSSWALDF